MFQVCLGGKITFRMIISWEDEEQRSKLTQIIAQYVTKVSAKLETF